MGIVVEMGIVVVLITGIILLQIYLSKKESKWAGLILPIIFFLMSLIYLLNTLIGFIYLSNTATPPVGGDVVSLVLGWLMANIPTIVLLTIYFAYREKQNRNKQLDKMNIQDLD